MGSITLANKMQDTNRGLRITRNLLSLLYASTLTQSIIAGTGTPTIVADDTNNQVTITIPAGLTGRAYVATQTISFLAGHTYAVSFEVLDYIPITDAGNVIANGSAITTDYGTLTIAKTAITANSKQCIIFQPNLTQSAAFRIGFGIEGNRTGAAITGSTIVVKNIMIEDISYSGIHIPSEYVEPKMSATQSFNYYGDLTTQTAGALTITKNIPYNQKGLSIAIFGDSFTNDTTDYPALLQDIKYPQFAVWYQIDISPGVTVAGTRPNAFLVPFKSKINKLINRNIKPTFVLLQSSINTISQTGVPNQDTAADQDIVAIRDAAIWAQSKGIVPVLTNVGACKAGLPNWLTGVQWHAQQRYDSKIYGLSCELGIPIFNLRGAVEDPAIPYLLLAANDSGDGMHPNATGGTAIATALHLFLQNLLK